MIPPKLKLLSERIIISILVIILGNLFWFFLIHDLKSGILTNSALQLVLDFLYPITALTLYIICCVIFAVFVHKKWIWLLVLILSCLDYFALTGMSILTFLGGSGIIATLFIFLISFDKFDVLILGKSLLATRITQAFSTPAFIISAILAINFYSIYSSAFSTSDFFISNAILSRILAPIALVYNDDLKVLNPSEKFKDYQQRIYRETKIPPDQVKIYTLQKLSLDSADDNLAMKDLIKLSINRYIIQLAERYKTQASILISFGLALIVQTLLSVSSNIASYIATGVFFILRKLKVTDVVTQDYSVTRDRLIE